MPIVTLESDVQPANACISIHATVLGIVIVLSDVHPENAEIPMLETLVPNVTFLSDVQLANAPCEIATYVHKLYNFIKVIAILNDGQLGSN